MYVYAHTCHIRALRARARARTKKKGDRRKREGEGEGEVDAMRSRVLVRSLARNSYSAG